MTEVFWDPEPNDAYDRLAADPTRSRLLASVDRIIDQLTRNPGESSVRRHLFTNGLWAVLADGDGESWALLWEAGTAELLLGDARPDDVEKDSTVVAIRYLGEDTFL